MVGVIAVLARLDDEVPLARARKGKYADLNKAIDCARRALDIEMPEGHSPLEAPQDDDRLFTWFSVRLSKD